MIGIENIATYIPLGRNDNTAADLLQKFDVTEDFVLNKIGVRQRAVKAADEDTSDLACSAVEALLSKAGLSADAIEVLIVVTQNPDHNLPHVSALVHGKLKLSAHCAAFDVGLGCSGYVYGLSILQGFMLANGLQRGVLITADPYSKIVDPDDKNTALLFGDAATATLIGPDPAFTVGPYSFGTEGAAHEALVCQNGQLSMNGRQVFNFAATRVAPHILALLERAGWEKTAVDAYLLHQGSKYIVDTICSRLGATPEQKRLGLMDVGNTVSSSIPLLLEQELSNPNARKLVLSGFGVGLSWASCLCERKEHQND
ncbi:ketoacyl-ACP synthase III [Alcaligenaceae bacterium C4P045]|nr:ketoacyl-ACP synthase III [Alcaligenaceae bacterium C4P045]